MLFRSNTYKGVARNLWNWVTYLGSNLLGVGTNQKYYVENGGVYYDITPVRTTLSLGADPFATTSGSYLVTVTANIHGATAGTFVTFSGVSGGGVVNGITLNGEFEIISVPTANSFTIVGSQTATSNGSGGGATVSAVFDINAGNSVASAGVGWGVPPWGSGGWGAATSTGLPLRVWSADNFNENLLFNVRNGELYWWQQDVVTYAKAITLEEAANSVVKFVTAGSFLAGATSILVEDTSGINTGSVVTGVNVAAGTYVLPSWDGSNLVPLSAPTTGLSAGDYSFSYSGKSVPNKTFQVLTSSVGNFAVALGANPYSPVNFSTTDDPLLVRWSDADNPYEWVPSTTNQAGEQHLSNGSYIVQAVNTRQEILIWTDAALFSMQYLGPPYVWGITLLMDNISIASPSSAVTVNNVTYWMGVDKFYMYSGRVETLPCSLRQYVFTDLNMNQLDQVVSGSNEGFNEVWWFYPSRNSQVNDRYVIFNHLERIWYYGTLNRTAWLDSPLREYPMGAFSVQNSYLDSTISNTATTITLLNALSYPAAGTLVIGSEEITYTGVDNNTLTGCVRGVNGTTAASHLQYAAVTLKTPNQILNHEYGNDDQSQDVSQPIAAYVESSDFDIGDGHNFGYVWRILPDLTFNNSSVENPSVVLTVKERQNSGTAYSPSDQPVVTRTAQYPIELYTGQVYTRVRGRQMAFRLDSTDIGVAWQMGMMRIDIRNDGRR